MNVFKMEQFGLVKEGVTINIQRSDGRVHQAIVTQLHPSSSSVSVEWCEKSETKGKEVRIVHAFFFEEKILNG